MSLDLLGALLLKPALILGAAALITGLLGRATAAARHALWAGAIVATLLLPVMDYRGHPLIWHTGNGDGQIAFMAMLPAERLGVAVMVNTWSAPKVHAARVNRISRRIWGIPRATGPARLWPGCPG